MRLQRIGRKNNPSYRVLVVDSRQGPKSGKFVDLLGSYDPKGNHVSIDGEKARAWIAQGVQVSGTVYNLLISQKIIEGKKINVLPRKSPIKKEGSEAVAPPADTAEAPLSETAPIIETPAEEAKEIIEEVSTATPAEEVPTEDVAEVPAESAVAE